MKKILNPYCLILSVGNGREVLLFLCGSGVLVRLPAEEWEAVRQGGGDAEIAAELTELGFLVEDPAVERGRMLRYLDEINRVNPKLTVAVILGMACNFNCRYCYEGTLKGDKAMSDETADQLVAYLKSRCSAKIHTLHLDFYGGEPLLYRQRIVYLAERLKPFMEERGGVFEFNLVTNGSLLTPKVVEELTAHGLIYAKVTIDGPPDLHNVSRPFKSGRESFDTIVDNLVAVRSMINIGLAGNYTNENYRRFPELLDLLAVRGMRPEDFELVNFNFVMRTNDRFSLQEYRGGCGSVNEPWLVEASLYVRGEVKKRGFTVSEIGPSPCAVEVNNACTVDWNGDLYKCATLIGHEEFRTGDIRQGEKDLSAYHPRHFLKEEECRDCVYLPLCFGGCRYLEYQRSGGMAKVDCMKEYYDRALPDMLMQDAGVATGD